MTRQLAWTGLLCLAAGAGPLTGQTPNTWNDLVGRFERYVRQDSIVGASLGMAREGRIVARRDVGWADRANRVPVSERTLYHWASITKTLTAVAVMQLRDCGRLTLDDRITSYIPELRQVHDSFGSVDEVTLRMLLSHSAGFQNPTWPYTDGRSWEPFEPTRWEQLVSMMPYQEIHFRPGSKYSYSNPGFIYLARVVEQLTGDPYYGYIEKNIWIPLGMNRSYFGATPYHLAADRSNNYTLMGDSTGKRAIRDNGRDFDPGITIPNGGWNAPLADVATWIGALASAAANPGKERGPAVVSRAALQEMWQEVVPVSGEGDPREGMGLSFFIYQAGGRKLVEHTGEQAGFRSFFVLNPRTGEAIIAAYNTVNDADPEGSGRGFVEVMNGARGLLLGRE